MVELMRHEETKVIDKRIYSMNAYALTERLSMLGPKNSDRKTTSSARRVDGCLRVGWRSETSCDALGTPRVEPGTVCARSYVKKPLEYKAFCSDHACRHRISPR